MQNGSTGSATPLATPVTQAASIVPGGIKALKVIFKESSTYGSFDSPSADGTAPESGLKAMRVFNPDGTLLADGPTSQNWPKWLSSVEIGISGKNNSSMNDPNCARFASPQEPTDTQCTYNQTQVYCGASSHFYRVSELDCAKSSAPRVGNGGSNDGVYIRVTFNRDNSLLGTQENILAVIEYTASSLGTNVTDIKKCWKADGSFNPSDPNCLSLSWQTYLKHNLNEQPQPFLLFVPPSNSIVNLSTNSAKMPVHSKQLILPLSMDQSLNIFQISRINAAQNDEITRVCNPSNKQSSAINSALCMGMVFYSMSLYRM